MRSKKLRLLISLSALVLLVGISSGSALASFSSSVSLPSALDIKPVKNVKNIKNFTCGNPITDRDGYSYNTVQVNNQCWMAENLRTKTKPDFTPLTNLSDGSERDCTNSSGTHGTESDCDNGNAVYLWDAAMNNSTTEGAQGLCMKGWHVPTDTEWHNLEMYLKNTGATCDASRLNSFDCNAAGAKLLPGGSANFDAALSGFRYTDAMFGDMFGDFDYGAYFWSSSRDTNDHIFAYNLNSDESRVWRGPVDNSGPFMSLGVRCIQD